MRSASDTLSWRVGELEARCVGEVRRGALFTTYRLSAGPGSDFALKVRGEGVDEAAHRVEYDFLSGGYQRWRPESLRPEAAIRHADTFLEHQARTLETVAGRWNLAFTGLSRQQWCGEEVLGLTTRWLDGSPLSEFSAARQRDLFPGLLPSLWDAIAVAPHGDLKPDNLLVSGNRFALLDPGAVLREVPPRPWTGKRTHHEDEPDPLLQRTNVLFVTTPAYYMALPPYYRGGASGADGLAAHLRATLAQAHLEAFGSTADEPTSLPRAADVHALGVAYYRLLTGAAPFATPMWTGLRRDGWQIAVSREWAGGAPPVRPPRAHDPAVSEAEARLAMALLQLEVSDRTHLVSLCRTVLESRAK